MKKIRVLIVEDSDVVRELLEHVIGSDSRLEVAATAPTAERALQILDRVSPDVISLDIRLPGMDGFEATRRIMRDRPTPIVVCSASVESEDLKITMNALRAGALAVVEKPVGVTRHDYERLARTLCTQLAIMSEVNVIRQRGSADRRGAVARAPVSPGVPRARFRPGNRSAVVGIGASTGGPDAVVQVLSALGDGFPLPVLLVQHIIPAFLAGFAVWLDSVVPGQVVVAEAGDTPAPGHIYLAPPDRHLRLDSSRLALTQDAPRSLQRPSATSLLESIAASAGPAGIGILLTGMGDDGADGMVAMRQAGGYTIAEHASTAVVYGMPKAAVDRGGASEVLPLPEIAPRVLELVGAMQRA